MTFTVSTYFTFFPILILRHIHVIKRHGYPNPDSFIKNPREDSIDNDIQ